MCERNGDSGNGVEHWCVTVWLLLWQSTGMVMGGFRYLRLLIVRYELGIHSNDCSGCWAHTLLI